MYIVKSENEYDVILVDLIELVGLVVNLFIKGFYVGILKVFKEDGIFVV